MILAPPCAGLILCLLCRIIWWLTLRAMLAPDASVWDKSEIQLEVDFCL